MSEISVLARSFDESLNDSSAECVLIRLRQDSREVSTRRTARVSHKGRSLDSEILA
jgi:hypothetical protein